MSDTPTDEATAEVAALVGRIDRLERRLARERRAREEAEDIAERVIRDLHAREAEAVAAREEMQQFLQAASHDLNNPVTTLAGFVHLLLDELDDEALAEMAWLRGPIERNLSFISAIVMDLLDLARAGHETGDRSAVDIARLSIEIAEQLDLDIRLVSASIPPVLLAPLRAEQLLTNLLGNAAKFGGPGTRVRVAPAPGAPTGMVRMHVSDNGPGIAPEDFDDAFRPFVRLETDQPGTGLGLPACRRICRAAGGDIRLVPATSGACVEIDLPAAPAEQ